MIPNLEIPIAGGLDVPLPKMALVRQRFDDSKLSDVGQAVLEQMQRSDVKERVRPGMKVAVGAGSRGIAGSGCRWNGLHRGRNWSGFCTG